MARKMTDFDEVIDRTEVSALKFDGDIMQSIFGEGDLWPSWVADMDFRSSPDVIEALSRRVDHGVFGYETSGGALPEAVVDWFRVRHDWIFDARHIVATPRTLNSLAVMVDLFSTEGDGVIVQPPVFYDFKLIINAGNRRLVKNPLQLERGKYRMNFEQLESVAAVAQNRLLILCNPHNPIGRVWSREDLSALSEICRANDVFVIADEIHGDITYRKRYIPLASVSSAASMNCATCISPIKSFNLAGVANSMIVIEDEAKREQLKSWYERYEVNKNNVLANAAMLAAYRGGEPWLEEVIEYLRGNIEFLDNFLRQRIARVKLVEPEGTYLLWLDFRELGLEPKQLEAFLVTKARMATNPGHWFGREGAGFARINIACPRSVLQSALGQLEKAVQGLQQHASK